MAKDKGAVILKKVLEATKNITDAEYVSIMEEARAIRIREAFWANAARAKEAVGKWPEWKQGIFGRLVTLKVALCGECQGLSRFEDMCPECQQRIRDYEKEEEARNGD